MFLTCRQFWAIAAESLRGILSEPILLLVTTSGLAITAALPTVILFQLGEAGRLVRDGAFALHMLAGLVAAGLAASATLHRELLDGTAPLVLSKPVGRPLFFLAKFAGVLAAILLISIVFFEVGALAARAAIVPYYVDMPAVGLIAVAVLAAYALAGFGNWLLRKPFVPAAFAWLLALMSAALALGSAMRPGGGFDVEFDSLIQWRMAPVSVLVFLALAVFAAVAFSLSARLPLVFAMPACIALFLLGLASDHFFGSRAADSALAAVLYALVPNTQHFWRADALAGGGSVPWSYVAGAAQYAALYSTAVLCAGLLLFRDAEIR